MFNQLLRAGLFTITAIGGLFVLFFSAAFVLFLIAAIAVIALTAAGVFWVRAKILGKPFGPKSQLDQMRRDMEAQMSPELRGQFDTAAPKTGTRQSASGGPVIDAHQTPEGWSVDR